MMLSLIRSSYFDNGTYSDLTIVCGEKRFLVHKIIVCVQSPYIEGLYEQAHQVSHKR